MSLAVWLLAALPLAAPPKLLVNAQLDTRSAAAGLESEFRSLLSAQPQPAWIAYTIPVIRGTSLGCEYVSPEGRSVPGVVHLEPPDHAVILFRVEAGAVNRIRALSPDCEIDGRGVPVHWLDDVQPPESTTLLASFATVSKDPARLRNSAIGALSVSSDPGALDLLIRLARTDTDRRVRQQCVSALARSRDPRAMTFLEGLLK